MYKKPIIQCMIMLTMIPAVGRSQSFIFETSASCTLNVKPSATKDATVYYKNISGAPLTIEWKVMNNTLPTGWDYSLCDNGQCYISVPQSSETGVIQAGERGFFILGVNPQNIEGSGELKLQLTDKANPANTAVLQFTVNAGKAAAISTESPVPDLTIYPNPVSDMLHLQLSYTTRHSSIRIFTPEGKEVFQGEVVGDKSDLDLAHLTRGIYFIRVTGQEGQLAAGTFMKK